MGMSGSEGEIGQGGEVIQRAGVRELSSSQDPETELPTWRRFQRSPCTVLLGLLEQSLALGLGGTSGRRTGLLLCSSATQHTSAF